jgi:glycosyltransferase involved in cell wall biosynthesis
MVPKYSICICTNRRLAELKRAVASALAVEYTDWELVVSDDGHDAEVARYVRGFRDKKIRYCRGPARGVAANRNNCVRHARGDYVTFLDDDVVMHPRFLSAVDRVISENGGAVVSGYYKEKGRDVYVPAFDYLGYMTRRPEDASDLEMVAQSAVVFPREVFEVAAFDENIVYGYEEADIAAQVKYRCGRRIVFCPDAYNYHQPSSAGRERYPRVIHASRIYTNAKKYFLFKRQYVRGVAYLAAAMVHLLCHLGKRAWRERNAAVLFRFLDTVVLVATYGLRSAAAGQRPPLEGKARPRAERAVLNAVGVE